MLDVGTTVAISRLLPPAGRLPAQPEGSYLVPIIDPAGDRWVTETELSRCEAALQAGTVPRRGRRPRPARRAAHRSPRPPGWPA